MRTPEQIAKDTTIRSMTDSIESLTVDDDGTVRWSITFADEDGTRTRHYRSGARGEGLWHEDADGNWVNTHGTSQFSIRGSEAQMRQKIMRQFQLRLR